MWGYLSSFTCKSSPRVHTIYSNSGKPEMTILGNGSLTLDSLNLSLQLIEVSFQKPICAKRQRNTTSDNCHSTIFLLYSRTGHQGTSCSWLCDPIALHTDSCQFRFVQGNLCG